MAIPHYQKLMLPVLKIAADGETRMPLIHDRIADQFGLSEAEREEMLPSGAQRLFYNRIAWAKFYLSKAGLIESPSRGRFVASVAGKKLVASNPEHLDVEALKAYPAFVAFQESAAKPAVPNESPEAFAATVSSSTPEEQIDAAQLILHSALKSDLLARIADQTPAFFERVIVHLLVAMGYGGSHEGAALRLGKSGDGGIDGVVDEDRLGLDRIYVQAKRYAAHVSVGRPDIQGFVGSLVGVGATKGVFVTTSKFSSQAIQYADALLQRVILIDGSRLAELMIEFDVGVRANRLVHVKRIDEDFFSDDV